MTTTTLIVRNAAVADAPHCQHLLRVNVGVFGWLPRGALERAATEQRLIVAEDAGQIVGMVHWNLTRYGLRVTLHEIAVLPARQGQGVGAALLADLIARVRAAGRAAIMLMCPDGLPANVWYARQGFVLLGQRDGGAGKRVLNVWRLAL